MSGSNTWLCRSPAATHALGRVLGEQLASGDFVALGGALGSGKTHFVKGMAAGLGVPADEPVVSPTFVLVREYVGRLKLFHLDAYRLGSFEELLDLGLHEMRQTTDAVVALEWADEVLPAVPRDACWVELSHAGPWARRVEMRWPSRGRLQALARMTIRDAKPAPDDDPRSCG